MNLTSGLQRRFVLLGIIAFLAVGALGVGSFGMATNADGQMSPCPFMNMGSSVVCKMTPFEHMSAWQSMFTAIPVKAISALTALLLLAFFAVFFFRDLWNTKKLQLISLVHQRFRDRSFVFRSPLQEAFSQGILNPKLF